MQSLGSKGLGFSPELSIAGGKLRLPVSLGSRDFCFMGGICCSEGSRFGYNVGRVKGFGLIRG